MDGLNLASILTWGVTPGVVRRVSWNASLGANLAVSLSPRCAVNCNAVSRPSLVVVRTARVRYRFRPTVAASLRGRLEVTFSPSFAPVLVASCRGTVPEKGDSPSERLRPTQRGTVPFFRTCTCNPLGETGAGQSPVSGTVPIFPIPVFQAEPEAGTGRLGTQSETSDVSVMSLRGSGVGPSYHFRFAIDECRLSDSGQSEICNAKGQPTNLRSV
jgi:hypothetical protein